MEYLMMKLPVSYEHKVLSQVMEDLKQDERLVEAGKERNKTLFKGLYNENFTETMVSRYEQNDQFFKDLFQDSEKMDFMKKALFAALYNDLKQNPNKEAFLLTKLNTTSRQVSS